jgi:hypothetical protein
MKTAQELLNITLQFEEQLNEATLNRLETEMLKAAQDGKTEIHVDIYLKEKIIEKLKSLGYSIRLVKDPYQIDDSYSIISWSENKC